MGKRTFKTRDGEPALMVTQETVKISANEENYVMSNSRGTSIAGPIAFASGSSQIRFGPLFTMNTEMAMMIPSTTATPTPVMMLNFPVQTFTSLLPACQSMMSMMSFGG